MRNTIIATAFAAMATVMPAQADTFFEEDIGYWQVFGDYGSHDMNPACVVDYTWSDGSNFQLTYDLFNGELYIWFRNFEWDISDPVDVEYYMNMVIIGQGNDLSSGTLTYVLVNKNTIYIPWIEPTPFLDAFAAMNELRFIMPGTIHNAYLNLSGSRRAVEALIDCVQLGNTIEFNEDLESLGEAL